MNFKNVKLEELNTEARKIFETSDILAIKDIFIGCESVAEINKAAIEFVASSIFED